MHWLAYILIIAALTGLDQIIKMWAATNLGRTSVMVIPGLLQLTYTENFGAAFSLFWNRRLPLIVITGLMIGGLLVYLLSGRCTDKFMRLGLMLIVAGGLGNWIDRVRLGFVIDYLDISPLFSYPIFNFADCMVFVGAIGLALYILFIESRHKRKGALTDD